jgi:hypothetical protein
MDLSGSGSSQVADACKDGRSTSVKRGVSTQRSPLASESAEQNAFSLRVFTQSSFMLEQDRRLNRCLPVLLILKGEIQEHKQKRRSKTV